jgi:formylglycine-generating enzyme required for sulfatase activity
MDTGDFSTALADALASAPGALGGRALAADVARRLPAEARKRQTPGYADWLAAGSEGGEVLLLPIGPKLPEIAAKPTPAVLVQAKPEAAPPAVQQAELSQPQYQQQPPQKQMQNPPSTVTRVPREVFRDCPDCPEMVVIPAGEFVMGSPPGEKGHSSNEGPQHRVMIGQPFAVGKHEVTFDEWDACVAAGSCDKQPNDMSWGRGRRPVIGVSWYEAANYADWLAKKTGQGYRLLSEAEWEYSARAESNTPYPWGNEPGSNRANFRDSGSQWSGRQTAPVGSFTANAFGLTDMIGNVWEWVEDCYHDDMWPGTCFNRVLRGGSWSDDPEGARSAMRIGHRAYKRANNAGFRLARTLP